MINPVNTAKHSFNLALKYLSYRPRTIHEMREYLTKKKFNTNTIKKTIENLLELNYLNDEDFAKLFIESKVRNNPKSKFAFQYELRKKGVSSIIIDMVLEQYDDQDLAFLAVKPKIKLWKKLNPDKFKKKMKNYLHYRGFNYDILISTLNHFTDP